MKNNNRVVREPFEEILKSKVEIAGIQYIKDILSSLSSVICILNDRNEVVFSNDAMLEKYNIDLEEHVLGVRPGDIFNCVNAKSETGGCGTTEKCEYCGAKTAFDQAWKRSEKVVRECRITSQKDNETLQLDLQVTATPILFEKKYLIVSIEDITERKRKALLERIFFHDVLNIAGGLSGILELLPELSDDKRAKFLEIASSLTQQIIDEIQGQQQMMKAELGELQPHFVPLKIDQLLSKLTDQVRFHVVAQEKQTEVVNEAVDKEIITDRTLLTRVLVNMIKNAMEAIPSGHRIVLKAKDYGDYVRFSVFNNTYMERDVQMQIFQRSYSTKGQNRGVGTYSMKLLGERYLQGTVGFTSTEKQGTVFYIDLPVSPEGF
ncbi:PAS domain-containing sensor histidine kinase [Sunxiuqinia dokdonensis]|uniref:Histidine kinase n=1 Tax=Sunxiuqinia dokdonensis TaxID=1409788 RepID=A0A0L8V5D0_9BACT|nr:PAS domain-containing sensor histidine kinase [Sunxiuqinia dokdonensis]KOH43583.1 histidine kinase [Sunxiuqinia dokdonensis]